MVWSDAFVVQYFPSGRCQPLPLLVRDHPGIPVSSKRSRALMYEEMPDVAGNCRKSYLNVSSGMTAPTSIRVKNRTFATFLPAPQLYTAAYLQPQTDLSIAGMYIHARQHRSNTYINGLPMFARDRKFESPAVVSPRPKPSRAASAVANVSTPVAHFTENEPKKRPE